MNFLEERILKSGIVKNGGVLEVDSFLNHQIDTQIAEQIGEELCRRFADTKITKVLTIETSGIAIAYPIARMLGVPLVYARKAKSVNTHGDLYVAEIPSANKKTVRRVMVSKEFLQPDDCVLVVDDILANGFTLQGLISIIEAAEATVAGLGIAIEKGMQEGGYRLRNLGYRLESVVVVDEMNPQTGAISFRTAE